MDPRFVELLVVGGGPAALETARGYREAGGTGEVLLVSDDRHPPYNRPPLTKEHLRGTASADELPLEDDSFYDEHDVELVLGRAVVSLDVDGRSARLDDGSLVAYGVAVLATGAEPTAPPVPGADHPGLFRVRSRVDGEQLRDAAGSARDAIVVGSGFIGCEAAASLALRGLEVTQLSQEELPQQDRLGAEVGRRIAGWLRELGVDVVGGVEVAEIDGERRVVVADGRQWSADLVVLATGVRPRAELAERAEVRTDGGRVVVDAHMRTSVPSLLAAGDVVVAHNDAAGRSLAVEHWGDALRMGEVAGRTAAGGDDAWAEPPGFWSSIGEHTLKYAAWGDGHDEVRVVDHAGGEAFTAWYRGGEEVVGVLTHDADDDYERGSELLARRAPWPPPGLHHG